MKRTLLCLTAVFAIVGVLAGPALAAGELLPEAVKLVGPAKDAPKELLLKAGDQIVCMGDSITAGGGYLRDMDAFLAQQYPDLKLPKIINAGVSGHKAENCIARFDKDVLKKKPALLTLNIGINDVWHRLKAPHDEKVLATYKENVGKMIDQAQAAGIKVVLLAPTVIKEEPEAEGQKRLALYVNAMKEIAAEKKCGFVDLHQMFLDALAKKPADLKGNWLTRDGVHMKPLGNAIMALAALRGMGVPDAKYAASADLTEAEVKELAAQFLKTKKLNWGNPIKIEKRDNSDYWVRYATPDREVNILSYRTLIVSADRSVKFLPRR